MNSDDTVKPINDPFGTVYTHTYDCMPGRPMADRPPTIDSPNGRTSPNRNDSAPRGTAGAPRETARSAARHTFEFRLAGSETQEQAWPGGGPAAGQVAIQRVRTYLSRAGAAPADPSAIAGLEVHAERRAAGIVCTAQLSDFGPAETVVVQVEVEVV